MAEQERTRTGRKKPDGVATSDVVHSSFLGNNAGLFPEILKLHVSEGAVIADVTFGKGVFWRQVDLSNYSLLASDIRVEENPLGVKLKVSDCRQLPYEGDSLDVVVFDPPYMEGFYRKHASELAGAGSHTAFRKYYSDGVESVHTSLKYHDRVVDMYLSSAIEAKRVLKMNGTYIVKTQDEVSANRQKMTHVEIIYGLEKLGFYCKDLFVITRTNKPGLSRVVKQEHARKNHSYFLIFKKQKNLMYQNCSDFVASYAS